MLYTINFALYLILLLSLFSAGETEAQRGEVTCCRSHGWDLSSGLFCLPCCPHLSLRPAVLSTVQQAPVCAHWPVKPKLQ